MKEYVYDYKTANATKLTINTIARRIANNAFSFKSKVCESSNYVILIIPFTIQNSRTMSQSD